MKKLLLCLAIFLIPGIVFGDSSIREWQFYSESLGFDRWVKVYLPDGYDPEGDWRYPVIYFLHGSSEGYPIYWSYFQFQQQLDNLISSGQIQPIIFVTPDGLIGPYDGGYWTNSELYGQFEDFVVEDLVREIDTRYKTIPARYFRGLHGLSMGGYGALKIGFKHWDKFRAIAAHSGPVVLRVAAESIREEVILENEPPPIVYNFGDGLFTDLMITRSGAFSPNLDNPPLLVDLPMDEWGELVEEVLDRWDLNCPAYHAHSLPPLPWTLETDLGIFFDCGTLDEYQAYEVNCALADSLDALGIPYVFESFVGGHYDRFAQRFPIGIRYIDSAFATWPTSASEFPVDASGMSLSIQGSNPNFGRTLVQYSLSQDSHARIDVYNTSGRKVCTLVDEFTSAGDHYLTWMGDDQRGSPVAAGVYFVRLQAGTESKTHKAVVLR